MARPGTRKRRNRGVTYWESGDEKRVPFTARNYLFALDAGTGKLVPSFGEGRPRLTCGGAWTGTPRRISISSTSPGTIYKDLIILGSRVSGGFAVGAG